MRHGGSRWLRGILAGVFALSTVGCGATTREKTTAGGAGAGALIGGIIGHQSGKTWQGALIGGAVGAIGGYIVGTKLEEKGPEAHLKSEEHAKAVAAFDRGNREPNKHAAIAFFTQAIDLDPTHPEFFNNRGLAFLDLGDKAQATINFQQALNVDPAYQPAQDNLRRLQWSGR